MTARSVAALFSSGTLWHSKPKNYCEAKGNMKITEKNWEQAQMIESGFQKQFSIVGETDQTGEGQNDQFTLRGDF